MDSVHFTLPNDFGITAISLPDSRINNGGDPVQIEWNPSLGSNGYIFAAVLMDSIYLQYGYSDFASVTSATIPRDAFQLSGNVNIPDTGWYYVYVYSYSGSPANGKNLPTGIPGGFTDNISRLDLDGRFGCFLVTVRDSIHVVVE